jgi:glycosyltransferase involved in cell wall biosynthesis
VRDDVALAHDSLYAYGGAERVLDVLLEMFPCAPLYVAGMSPAGRPAALGSRSVRTSPLGRLPLPVRARKLFFPLVFASFRLPRSCRLLISSSSGYAKGLRPPVGATHVSYVHTPLRRAWNPHHRAASIAARGLADRIADRLILEWFRRWDLRTAGRVHRFVANSRNTATQIMHLYGRVADVVYPPVDTRYFDIGRRHTPGDYYLVVSRLDPYKRVDLAIQAAAMARRPLVVAGEGTDGPRLQALASAHNHVRFVGRVTDRQLRDLYAGARALLFPGEEDFGIVPVEAQASGVPVVAYGVGGATETVIDGETGVLFSAQTVGALVNAMEKLEHGSWDAAVLRKNALRFDTSVFRERFRILVEGLDTSR